jgi:hypothetical protein
MDNLGRMAYLGIAILTLPYPGLAPGFFFCPPIPHSGAGQSEGGSVGFECRNVLWVDFKLDGDGLPGRIDAQGARSTLRITRCDVAITTRFSRLVRLMAGGFGELARAVRSIHLFLPARYASPTLRIAPIRSACSALFRRVIFCKSFL